MIRIYSFYITIWSFETSTCAWSSNWWGRCHQQQCFQGHSVHGIQVDTASLRHPPCASSAHAMAPRVWGILKDRLAKVSEVLSHWTPFTAVLHTWNLILTYFDYLETGWGSTGHDTYPAHIVCWSCSERMLKAGSIRWCQYCVKVSILCQDCRCSTRESTLYHQLNHLFFFRNAPLRIWIMNNGLFIREFHYLFILPIETHDKKRLDLHMGFWVFFDHGVWVQIYRGRRACWQRNWSNNLKQWETLWITTLQHIQYISMNWSY